jgi:hypothetical protein
VTNIDTNIVVAQDQLEEHVDERVQLQIYTYYGPNRITDHTKLGLHDVVLTTYQTLTADVKVCGLQVLTRNNTFLCDVDSQESRSFQPLFTRSMFSVWIFLWRYLMP